MSNDWLSLMDWPLYGYSRMRNAFYSLQGFIAEPISSQKRLLKNIDPATLEAARESARALLREDAANIRKGIYPLSVLLPEPPLRHLKRLPALLLDGIRLSLRRASGKSTVFSDKARKWLDEVPRYYRRNFHFQTDGYLSETSARLYDHQVEILFAGTADAMRRLLLPPLKSHFGGARGKGLRFLEIGAGTGSATDLVRQTFPDAQITASELSPVYLQEAKSRLGARPRMDFVRADGAALPFKDCHFDAVYSVFLFHEMPLETRLAVLKESVRLAKPGGFVGLVDALQTGDTPALDPLFANFPEAFHEPFYRNYRENPIDTQMREAGIPNPRSRIGFLSKVVWGVKPENQNS